VGIVATFVHCKFSAVTSHIWPIVLAAGAGRRLSGVTGGMPKQFFRPAAGESLLGMTLARVAPLARPERTVIIVDESHRPLLDGCEVPKGMTVLFQPADRGTATGVLMALMPVLAAAPDDVVVLTPADHAVADGDGFRRGVRAAVRFAEEKRAITLFAVEPSEASPDFGWIIPDHPHGHLARVTAFVEKPEPAVAERLHEQGAVWNTMVVVGRASDVRALYEVHLPELAGVFETALSCDNEAARDEFLARAYPALRPRDFSRDLLERARTLFVYTWPASIGWSDLGTPERLYNWLKAGAA
jgi:mannose-1-phosphate guanylyltransferase